VRNWIGVSAPSLWLALAESATLRGEHAEALDLLENAERAGYNNPNQLVRDPVLAPLRETPWPDAAEQPLKL
jgi:hypothetical protein